MKLDPKKLIARFMTRVNRHESGCWLWAGYLTFGYGRIRVSGVHWRAHRLSHELFIGPIPIGLTIDHLCRVRHCVNPKHLEAVPGRINTLRGDTLPAKNAIKTHCPRGHAYTPENTYVTKKRRLRQCKACNRARGLAYRAALKVRQISNVL